MDAIGVTAERRRSGWGRQLRGRPSTTASEVTGRGREVTGVTQAAAGGSATGAAPDTYEAGIEDYRVLKNDRPATGAVGSTTYRS